MCDGSKINKKVHFGEIKDEKIVENMLVPQQTL